MPEMLITIPQSVLAVGTLFMAIVSLQPGKERGPNKTRFYPYLFCGRNVPVHSSLQGRF